VTKFYQREGFQLSACGIFLVLVFANPIGELLQINTNSFDTVQIIKKDGNFLACKHKANRVEYPGGAIKKEFSHDGVEGYVTNPTIDKYFRSICFETVLAKNSKTISLKPHPLLDSNELKNFKTIEMGEIPKENLTPFLRASK
jgi:hypothetical protein